MTLSLPPLADRRMVLATDLDGTFLGGTDDDRDQLYDWLRASRDTVGLVFVTGRDPQFIAELCGDGRVPWPEYVIGDVGTTIAEVRDSAIHPIEPLEKEISQAWGDLGHRVRDTLKDRSGLSLQQTEFRYRLSYDMDPDALDPQAKHEVEAMGADVLISDNRFFDVLPRGVSKGPSLIRLIAHLGLSPNSVLAAGDTLNDLSMLVAGTPAVAVGGSEEPLLDQLPQRPTIYRAEAIGAAGIVEAISAFDLHPDHLDA
ncbi:HAD superfamily hydrolase (TIGR01484 family) [Litoreibacter ponti]|uniref:HAD superfamily hydrolase (TIGR01484 family) n=1 Tax=Litoreibacter ponti TaxID=1510457 RepID=A0A2T6BHF7_9RHOB|nr:HAD-IIB family hydrolase [Litoreibacter ponti]PTX55495.1 HAD superfamily hydrolase (TIGR01484 family) [Litoreibacter ponti]